MLKNWLDRNPWYPSLAAAKRRCNNPKNDSYRFYGARGIKCFLTLNDIKKIWIRDNAKDMKQPSIDRINLYGNYDIENTRFIEMNLNRRRQRRKRITATTCKICGLPRTKITDQLLCDSHYREYARAWQKKLRVMGYFRKKFLAKLKLPSQNKSLTAS